MNLEIDNIIFEKQQNMFSELKKSVITFFSSYLTETDKADASMGYISIIATLRVCANMAVMMGIDKEKFLVGCSNMYAYEEKDNKEESVDIKKNIPNLDLN